MSWRVRAIALLWLFRLPLLSAQTVDPQALLDSLQSKVQAVVRRASRYTCTASIERSWYLNRKEMRPGCDTDRSPQTGKRDLVRSDRLRLDVAIGSGQEIFAWHGDEAFRTEDIDSLVTTGPIASGTYFSFLSSIFLEGLAKVEYRGPRKEQGRTIAVFGYAVPIAQSKFETRTESGKSAMGYHGEFTVDVSAAKLEVLQIVTDEMPEEAEICSFSLELHYERSALLDADFKLPSSVVMDVLTRDRQHKKMVLHYGDCHEFHGESKLRFDSFPSVTHATPSATKGQTLGAGLKLEIRVGSNIKAETAWAGDPINGRLAADVLDEQGNLIAPRGAIVSGRLLRFEILQRPVRSYKVALQFSTLSVGGKQYRHFRRQVLIMETCHSASRFPCRLGQLPPTPALLVSC